MKLAPDVHDKLMELIDMISVSPVAENNVQQEVHTRQRPKQELAPLHHKTSINTKRMLGVPAVFLKELEQQNVHEPQHTDWFMKGFSTPAPPPKRGAISRACKEHASHTATNQLQRHNHTAGIHAYVERCLTGNKAATFRVRTDACKRAMWVEVAARHSSNYVHSIEQINDAVNNGTISTNAVVLTMKDSLMAAIG